MRIALLFSFLLITMAVNAQSKSSAPDVIFFNGDIYRGAFFGVSADPSGLSLGTKRDAPQAARKLSVTVLPRAQAMAIKDGRIVAIGSNSEVRKLKGSHTRE